VRIFANNGQYLGAIVKAPDPQMINRELIRGLAFDPSMGVGTVRSSPSSRGSSCR